MHICSRHVLSQLKTEVDNTLLSFRGGEMIFSCKCLTAVTFVFNAYSDNTHSHGRVLLTYQWQFLGLDFFMKFKFTLKIYC